MGIQDPQNEFGEVLENYKRICENVENARAKYRSSDEKIDIMAVTKTVAPEKINFAIEQGILPITVMIACPLVHSK